MVYVLAIRSGLALFSWKMMVFSDCQVLLVNVLPELGKNKSRTLKIT